ncbi:alpha/beta fold hydrolase [Streptomyces sp. NRRL B-24484]|uniref:alpha/beta fold hydrolase n=1 Tax=Streptomyces sp. NRRL B-24484 TaxID=1463833 RepID=UPI0004C13B0C|nr:alpha/beta hydrolase [Streptomyces sp. NRRL B-24484]
MGTRERWTPSGVRLRRVSAGDGRRNWLFVPGGPGLGSESVEGLARAAGVPGAVWLVDLPGDGSNRGVPGVPAEPYLHWPDVLVEAAEAVERPVMVGHSTGGMFLLSVPALEQRLAGLVLVGSAPHAGWRAAFEAWAAEHPLPGLAEAAGRYAAAPDDDSLRALTLAAAPWSFTPAGLPAGLSLLAGLPYCRAAAAWADDGFDEGYRARWAPGAVPALVLGGAEDRIVDQGLWQREPAFAGPHVLHRTVPHAGHFPWVEDPAAVRGAFAEFSVLLDSHPRP